jgi:hypothetical protein
MTNKEISNEVIKKIISHYEDFMDYDYIDEQYVLRGKDWQDCVYEIMGKEFKDYEFLAEICEKKYNERFQY